MPDDTPITALFTPEEKQRLMKMIKHGEFNVKEAAILKVLMAEAFNFEELGVYLGVCSPKTKGEPMSKIAARKELMRILKVLGKRAHINADALMNVGKTMSANAAEARAKRADYKRKYKEYQRRKRDAYKEFWDNLRELNRAQRKAGLPVSHYEKVMKGTTVSRDAMMDGGNR